MRGKGEDARTTPPIVLAIKPSRKPGRFLGYIDDELIVTNRQPSLDGARTLLASRDAMFVSWARAAVI